MRAWLQSLKRGVGERHRSCLQLRLLPGYRSAFDAVEASHVAWRLVGWAGCRSLALKRQRREMKEKQKREFVAKKQQWREDLERERAKQRALEEHRNQLHVRSLRLT